MPKAIKGNAGRKPPEPSARHSDIDDWLGLLVPYLQPIVKGLDESIRAAVPGLHYAVKWKRAFYGLPGLGWIIGIALGRLRECRLPRRRGLRTPPPLGTTDRTRYVKVTTLEEGHRLELHDWIEQAGRTPGWK
jgi:hypothetical protein